MLNRATISPQEAVEILRENGMQIGVEVLRLGLQQGVFPFGKAVKTEEAPVYWVFPKDLNAWIERHLKDGPTKNGEFVEVHDE